MMTHPAPAIDDMNGPAGHREGRGRALPPGTRLREYDLGEVASESGFDIVYRAWDAGLQRKVSVKEFLPVSMATRAAGSSTVTVASDRQRDAYRAGLKAFVAEARLLARFDHASLVKVYRFWEENGTAYMVMPLYEGPTLETALAELDHVPSESELRAWLKPILNAIALLHEGGAWHQNIGPDSIVLTPVGPVLFGLGSAEQTIAAIEHTPAAALKPGYAAIEQYGNAAETTRGPWTDLYALAAVIHTAITGSAPPAAAGRLAEDTLRPLSAVAAGLYGERFLAAIDAALAVEPERRPQGHQQFRALMGDIDSPAPLELAPQRDLMHEPFVGSDGKRETTVPDHPLLTIADPAVKAVIGAAPAAAPAPSPKPAGPERPSSRAGAESVPPSAKTSRPAPWVAPRAVGQMFGKRALYGLVAGTGALIGVGALALQFYARQAGRPAPLPAPAAASATLVTPATTAASPGAAPVTGAASLSPAAAAPGSGTTAASLPAGASALPSAGGVDRQARCIEILQKASLERISPDETEFFKRECK